MVHGQGNRLREGRDGGKGIYRKTIKDTRLQELFEEIRRDGAVDRADELAFLCIGTDRSSGDALGPLTGTLLTEAGFPHVIGTLEKPCDAESMELLMKGLPDGLPVVAIDASLGLPSSVGRFQVSNGPLLPGEAVSARLGPVGDYSIAAVVHENRAHPKRVLEMTPLGRVLTMARAIVRAAVEVFPPGAEHDLRE